MLRITDMRDGFIKASEAHRVSQELSDQYTRTLLCGGEVVVSLVGTIGAVAYVPDDCAGFNVHRNLAVISLMEHLRSQSLELWLKSPEAQNQIKEFTTGGNQPLFNLGDLKCVAVPVPPLKEQDRILETLNEALEMVESVSAVQASIESSLTGLDQSILSKAFRGELVPQDPRDEPASELLERIRQQREAAEAEKKAKKTAKRKRKATPNA